MELEKILPKHGPSKSEVQKYIDKYKDELIVIKYGGNVFIDRKIFDSTTNSDTAVARSQTEPYKTKTI